MNPHLKSLKVQDLMQSNPMRLGEDMSLEEICRLFTSNNLECAPVVDHNNRLQGWISLTDLEKSRQLYDLKEYLNIIVSGLDKEARQVIDESFSFDGPIDLKAREVMSVKVPRVYPNDSIELVSQRMMEYRTHYAMVIDSDYHVVGLVSSFDLIKQLQPAVLLMDNE